MSSLVESGRVESRQVESSLVLVTAISRLPLADCLVFESRFGMAMPVAARYVLSGRVLGRHHFGGGGIFQPVQSCRC